MQALGPGHPFRFPLYSSCLKGSEATWLFIWFPKSGPVSNASPFHCSVLRFFNRFQDGAKLDQLHWPSYPKKHRIENDGTEPSTAMQVTLNEIEPGRPPAGLAAPIDTAVALPPHSVKAVQEPERSIKPKAEWPSEIQPARTKATKHDWQQMTHYLCDRDILSPAERPETPATAELISVLGGVYGVLKKGEVFRNPKSILRFISIWPQQPHHKSYYRRRLRFAAQLQLPAHRLRGASSVVGVKPGYLLTC